MGPLREVDIGLLAFMQDMCARLVVVANQGYNIVTASITLEEGLVHTLIVGEVIFTVEIAYYTQLVGIVTQPECLFLYSTGLQTEEVQMCQHTAVRHTCS